MSANEDPGSGSEPAGPARPSDDLEGWLSDLRTEVSADPSGWINEDAEDDPPTGRATERSPVIPAQRGAEAAEPSSGGRHRAPD